MLFGKCLLDDNENLCFDTAAKSNTWKDHHNCFLNQKFVWNQRNLFIVHPVVGPVPFVTGVRQCRGNEIQESNWSHKGCYSNVDCQQWDGYENC